MKKRNHIISYTILAVLIIFIIILSYFIPGLREFFYPENLRTFVFNYEVYAFLIYIIVLALSVPLPIPSTPVILAGGFIFGASDGLILGLVGVTLGSLIYFSVGRLGGRKLIEKLVDQHHLKHFDRVFKKRGISVALISYSIPVFPADTMSVLLGLTRISYLSFLLIVIVGYLPRLLIINVLGSNLLAGLTLQNVFALILAVLLLSIAFFREKIKKFFFREIKELEKK